MKRALLVAGAKSGSGKTITTLILAAALRRLGAMVRCAKAGPDYIDPSLHQRVTAAPSHNLDTWAMRRQTLADIIEISTAIAQAPHTKPDNDRRDRQTLPPLQPPQLPPTLIIEGVTGLFDGAMRRSDSGYGSTAELAHTLGVPIVLALDASGSGATLGAIAHGLTRADAALKVVGVIATNVASKRHADLVRSGVETLGGKFIGYIERNAQLALPRRHLGLLRGNEHVNLTQRIDAAAAKFLQTADADQLLSLAAPLAALTNPRPRPTRCRGGLPPLGQNIAIARDDAFCFLYPAQMELWRARGCCISYFSPVANQPPAPDADAIFLPGGYPELFASAIAHADNFHRAMNAASQQGTTIYGECGGYMVLGRALSHLGKTYPMLNLLGHHSTMQEKLAALGYRQVQATSGDGQAYNAHEFHYASSENPKKAGAAFTSIADGSEFGERRGNVCGSFLHLIDLKPTQAAPPRRRPLAAAKVR